jgi:hypothetical protein
VNVLVIEPISNTESADTPRLQKRFSLPVRTPTATR